MFYHSQMLLLKIVSETSAVFENLNNLDGCVVSFRTGKNAEDSGNICMVLIFVALLVAMDVKILFFELITKLIYIWKTNLIDKQLVPIKEVFENLTSLDRIRNFTKIVKLCMCNCF